MGAVYYIGLIVWSTFECILVSAICFGWPQLLEVLEKERYFASYCYNDNNSTLTNINQTLNGDTCSQQDSILNLVYSFSTFATATAVFAGGRFLDIYGFRKTRLLSCVIYIMAGILMYLSTLDAHELLFPGIILTSAGGACFLSCLVKLIGVLLSCVILIRCCVIMASSNGPLVSLSCVTETAFNRFVNKMSIQAELPLLYADIKVCGIIPSRRYTAISVMNGAIDSSAVILLLFKLSYTAGLSFENIIVIYFTFAVGHSILFTFTLFPKKLPDCDTNVVDERNCTIDRVHENGRNVYVQDVDDEPPNERKYPEKASSLSMVEISTYHGELQMKNQSNMQSNEEKCPDKVICSSDDKNPDIPDSAELENQSHLHQDEETFLSIVKTPKYIIHTCFLSAHVLRLFTFLGMLNLNLKRLSSDKDEVDFYLTLFGIIQFGGIAFSFFPGFLLDWRPKGRHDSFSLILSFVLTGFISIFLTIGVLIPSFKLQILSFFLQTLLRSFVYSCHGSFIIKEFPLRHSGALYGLSNFVSALVSLLQFPLFILIEGPCSGDPTWVNLGLLIIQIIMFGHPFYLWSLTKKESVLNTTENDLIQR